MLDEIIKYIDFKSAREKILLLPNYVNPGIIKRNLALKYNKLCNLKIDNYKNFFIEKSEEYFSEYKYIDDNERLRLINNILYDSYKKLKYFNRYNKFKYFQNFIFEGNSSLLSDLFIELKLNYINKEELAKYIKISDNKDKWSDILYIFDKYENFLETNKLFDYADSISILINKNIIFDNVYIIPEKITAMENKLIKISQINEIEIQPTIENYELIGFKSDTENQEVMQVIRMIIEDLKTMKPPIKIGICVNNYNKYYHHFKILNKKIFKNNLFHFLKGIPFFYTSVGPLLKYFTEWINNNNSVFRLIILLESGLINYKNILEDINASDYYQSIKYFKKSDISLFDNNFHISFTNYLKGNRPKNDEIQNNNDTKQIKIAEKISFYFNNIINSPSPSEVIMNLVSFIEKCAYINNITEVTALNKLKSVVKEILTSLSQNVNKNYDLNEMILLMNQTLENTYIPSPLPDYTLPIIGTEKDLQYFEFDKLYILGLNENNNMSYLKQNPLFLDYEKNNMKSLVNNAIFYTKENLLTESNNEFLKLKSTVKKHLILSAPIRDLETGRTKLVSRYFIEEWNRKNNTNLDYNELDKLLSNNQLSTNNYITLNPSDSIYNYEVAVSIITKELNNSITNYKLSQYFNFSFLTAKKTKLNLKAFDEYWGSLNLNTNRDLGILSASRITSWVFCPYKYFLKYELNLEEFEDYDSTNLEWLPKMDFGSFIHNLFNNFFIELTNKYGKEFNKIKESDKNILDKTFTELIENYKKSFPITSELYYKYQENQLYDIALRFLTNEIKDNNKRVYTELSFGLNYEEDDNKENMKIYDPPMIKLKDNTKIFVRGFIDRIDKDESGRYILIDYKTGKVKEFDENKPFNGGSLAQAGIYSEVINQIDKNIINPIFKYYSFTKDGNFKNLIIDYKKYRSHFLELLTSIIKEMRKGNFIPNYYYYYSKCDECEYYKVCIQNRIWLFNKKKEYDSNYNKYKNITEKENIEKE